MGGDHGPDVVIPAAIRALNKHPSINLILVGDEKTLTAKLKEHHVQNDSRFIIHHASQQVEMDESEGKKTPRCA